MRLKNHIFLIVFAVFFLLVGYASIIVHYCLKDNHSLVCYFISGGILITLTLGAIYILRGYQKEDSVILKGYISACILSVIAELIYCVKISGFFPIFARCAIIAGGTSIVLLSGLLFGKDLGKKKSLIMSGYTVFMSFALLVTFLILARNPVFKGPYDIAAITVALDLVSNLMFGCILTVSMILKYKDKEERNTK